jgi:hypothetical protein
VFRRVNGEWRPDARLHPVPASDLDGNGMTLSVSGDGTRFVVGLPSAASGASVGEALVYAHTSSGWGVETTNAPAGTAGPYTGTVADIDAAGDRLLVSNRIAGGTFEIYEHSGSAWTLAHTIVPGGDCYHGAISADGLVIAMGCSTYAMIPHVEVFAAPDWTRRNHIEFVSPSAEYTVSGFALDRTGNSLAVGLEWPEHSGESQPNVHVYHRTTGESQPNVHVYHRTTGEYALDATLAPGTWFNNESWFGAPFGSSLAFSRDGGYLAVGHGGDDGAGAGVFTPPLAQTDPALGQIIGAVYLYEKRTAGWNLRRVIKPRLNTNSGTNGGNFGASVALGDNGKTLVVGHSEESTLAPNPGSQQTPNGISSGAVWIY